MGRDKALLPYAGATLIEYVAGEMRAAAGSVTVVGCPGRYRDLGLPLMDEEFAGCGPLSGIEAALRVAGEGWAAIAACDMPAIRASWIRCLISAAGESEGCDAVVTLDPSGRAEPLCAVYHARLHADVRKALTDGRFAVRGLLPQWRVRWLSPGAEPVAANINTPEEWVSWSR